MINQGLGQIAAPEAPAPQGQGELEDVLVQIIQLLEQGITAEELVAQGVPAELVQQAMQMMQSQQAPAAQAPEQMLPATEQALGLPQ